MAYQSLYRRYRPQRFGEVVGQERVTTTLRNAVRDGRVAHAYLFSGPRGTGKTSTARILAKALNCTNLQDGEPCDECDSCVQITAGTSLDVMELDAASNNGVDAMRDLISRAALGTAGRSKVYIVDEVHMLSTGASNALLKTLEEPPGHVHFVLATTDPQKVLATIKSRTQHFDFRLLPHDVLADHLRWVVKDAGLDVAAEAIELVARRGNGSVRDALSALDQVAAAGGIDDESAPIDDLVEALCDREPGRALAAVADAVSRGHDPRQLARELVEQLRNGFLALMARQLVPLPDEAAARVEDQARRLGAAGVTRAIETVGQMLVDMRDSLDPRIALEVALVRLAQPDADVSPAALLERIERLERKVAGHVVAPVVEAAHEAVAAAAPTPAPAAPRRRAPAPPPPPAPDLKRVEHRGGGETSTGPVPTGDLPSRDELVVAWGDAVLGAIGPGKARWAGGRWVRVDPDAAVFAVPNEPHRERCEPTRPAVEEALAAHFGRPVPVRLEVEGTAPAPAREPDPAVDDDVDVSELTDAPAAVTSDLTPLMQHFPGAVEVEE
ncbi:MAG TPA: DNA polymerase III subunit gamma/tau [Acidimicrobiales bacterium]|nr:DNA polymerase III subunit gamma/tau [Acidimicrobiales bacterium]